MEIDTTDDTYILIYTLKSFHKKLGVVISKMFVHMYTKICNIMFVKVIQNKSHGTFIL